MTSHGRVSPADVAKLPPLLFGTIRWNRSIGRPAGDLCSGFRIRVDERTSSEFVDLGGGHYGKVPGTGIWRLVTASAPCSVAPTEGPDYVVTFTVPDVHLNVLDGVYRVAPDLAGAWDRSLLTRISGFRQLDPLAWYVALRPEAHIATIDFRVVRRSLLGGIFR
jgi:hypothetical protein